MNLDINTVLLFGIALLNAIAAIAAWQTKRDAAEIKLHSNSMKDEVVKAKEEVARLTGLFQGRTESERAAANHAKGVLAAGGTVVPPSAVPRSTTNGPIAVEVMNTKKPVPVRVTKEQIKAKIKPPGRSKRRK